MSTTTQAVLRRKQRQQAVDVRELRHLVEAVMGIPAHGSRLRLAELVGCSSHTVTKWEKGRRPSLAYVPRLIELEAKLRARKGRSVDEELLGEVAPIVPAPLRPMPLVASAMSVKVEGEQALVTFTLKIPGESMARVVAEVLIPRSVVTAG